MMGMFVAPSPEEKFRLIREARLSPDHLLSVSELCRISGVSRSGYYRWEAATASRNQREIQDQVDFALRGIQASGLRERCPQYLHEIAASHASSLHEHQEDSEVNE